MTPMSASRQDAATSRTPAGTRVAHQGVTVIVPCFNEEQCLVATLRQIAGTMDRTGLPYELIVVDDGSTDGTPTELETCTRKFGVRALRNDVNRGYGYSLKRALREARFETIVITDADGTYPNERIGELVDVIDDAAMVVGARTGVNVNVPLVRRPAKWVLRRLASYLAETDIPDLNSGLRVMKKSLVRRFMNLLPDGFSFTTTITLALLTHGYRVHYVPIDYARRVGKSSIRPIRDTMSFLSLVVRTVMYFKPLKVFAPVSAGLFALAVVWALVSLFVFGKLADVSVLVVAMASTQMLAIGLLADLISKRTPVVDNGPEAPRELRRASAAKRDAGVRGAFRGNDDQWMAPADRSNPLAHLPSGP